MMFLYFSFAGIKRNPHTELKEAGHSEALKSATLGTGTSSHLPSLDPFSASSTCWGIPLASLLTVGMAGGLLSCPGLNSNVSAFYS